MIVHKIFHSHQSLEETRQCLREVGAWSGSEDVTVVTSVIDPKGTGRFEFRTQDGHRISADVEEVPADDPNRILFRSVGGGIELAGLVEFFPIRPNLTEVSLTLDYEPVSALQKVFGTMDRFLNRQIERIERCMERAHSADAGGTLSGGFA